MIAALNTVLYWLVITPNGKKIIKSIQSKTKYRQMLKIKKYR